MACGRTGWGKADSSKQTDRQCGQSDHERPSERATGRECAGWTYTRCAHTPYKTYSPPVSVPSEPIGEHSHNTTQCLGVVWDPHASRPARAHAATAASGTTLFVTLAAASQPVGARRTPSQASILPHHSSPQNAILGFLEKPIAKVVSLYSASSVRTTPGFQNATHLSRRLPLSQVATPSSVRWLR